MDREFLTDEQIAKEKKETLDIKSNKLKKEIEEMISIFEAGSCSGRLQGRHHYMSKINSDGIMGGYLIRCEFCGLPGINVNLVNLYQLSSPPPHFFVTYPENWDVYRAEIEGLLKEQLK